MAGLSRYGASNIANAIANAISDGNIDTNDFTYMYNTKLSPKEELEFLDDANKNKYGLDLRDLYNYDLRGYWKEAKEGKISPDERGHLTDRYKKPNHTTFSDQSIYSGVNGYSPGHWGNDWYRASIDNRTYPEDLQKYFEKNEPGFKLYDNRRPLSYIDKNPLLKDWAESDIDLNPWANRQDTDDTSLNKRNFGIALHALNRGLDYGGDAYQLVNAIKDIAGTAGTVIGVTASSHPVGLAGRAALGLTGRLAYEYGTNKISNTLHDLAALGIEHATGVNDPTDNSIRNWWNNEGKQLWDNHSNKIEKYGNAIMKYLQDNEPDIESLYN